MKKLHCTLSTDGSSDRVLIPILSWLLQEHLSSWTIKIQWADPYNFPYSSKTLAEKIKLSLELHPCDLLFVHRDAEKEKREFRKQEIDMALEELKNAKPSIVIPAVCVIPVRMTEAWLLFDEVALRKAVDNPTGKTPLNLPKLKTLEALPNPKQILYELLKQASELKGSKLQKFNVNKSVHRVAESITDFSLLRQLSAFQALEAEIQNLLLVENGIKNGEC